MMNQEEKTQTAATSIEEQNFNDPYGVQTSYLSANCNLQGEDHSLRENGGYLSSTYQHDQQLEKTLPVVQDQISLAPVASVSCSGLANVAQDYSGHASYSNTDPYAYSNTGYAPYYSQYQQQTNQYQQQSGQYQLQPGHYQQQPGHYLQQPSQYQPQPNNYQQEANLSYPQQVGAYQNTGAPYQPLSSFQNTGSFGESASYSSTYYSPGDYQTSGSYTSGTYGSQTNFWHGAPYTNYTSHQYSNFPPDSNSAYGSTTTVATSQYQQRHKQWEGYYSQSPTEVICAPGTENISAPISSVNSFVASQDSLFAASTPAPYTPLSRPESSSSELTYTKPVATTGSVFEGYWTHDAPTFNSNPPNLVSQSHQPTFQTVSKPPEPPDSRKACKLQIPTNPRIVSSLPSTLSRMDKDSSIGSTTQKPAYISVLKEKSNENITPHEEAESMLKPCTFPKSLRGYVERALARCKNDMQKAACQSIMKEIITSATADGTLHTKDWDTEALFPLPNSDMANEANSSFSVATFHIPKSNSPSRRAKSRWEPVQEKKTVEKSTNTYLPTKYGFWNNKQFSGGQIENKDHLGTKFSFTDQTSFSRNAARPAKRQRLGGDDPNASNSGEMSSDSDQEQSLTKYYSAAIALNNTPEEKKRRENRSKRFEKKNVNQRERSNARVSAVGAGQSYVRFAGALSISKSCDESGNRAVEDIDCNALVIKGTCQEIEKRYLRLTSAPDPAMVRPEEVLEKALVMVQNSDKNYLYKCDQLKSIRQDLTVQHIRNELTVKVYEIHARLAIEAGDLPEYNQCQSQLKTLYAEGIFGCHMEFAAYNLLCEILHSNNNRDLLTAMSRLSVKSKEDKAVQHALSVRTAVTSGNYVMFFRLYSSAPNLNAFFMDLYVEKMRYAAVKCMSRSYRPMVPVSYLSQILGFSNALPTNDVIDGKEVGGLEECIDWLRAHGACLVSDSSGETLFDTKASVSSLYMPEPEDAVSHGDTSLAVNDFFTRSSS